MIASSASGSRGLPGAAHQLDAASAPRAARVAHDRRRGRGGAGAGGARASLALAHARVGAHGARERVDGAAADSTGRRPRYFVARPAAETSTSRSTRCGELDRQLGGRRSRPSSCPPRPPRVDVERVAAARPACARSPRSRSSPRGIGGVAEAGQVQRDHAVPSAKARDVRQPVLPPAAEAVDEDERRALAAGSIDVDRAAGRARIQRWWRRQSMSRHSVVAAGPVVVAGAVGPRGSRSAPWTGAAMRLYRTRGRAHRHRHRLHAAPLLGPARRRSRSGASASRCPTSEQHDVGDHRARGRELTRLRGRDPRAPRRAGRRARTRARSRRSARWHAAGPLHPRHQPPHDRGAARPPRAGWSESACPTTTSTAPTTRSRAAWSSEIDVLIDDSPVNLVARASGRHRRRRRSSIPGTRDLCDREGISARRRLAGARRARRPAARAGRVSDVPRPPLAESRAMTDQAQARHRGTSARPPPVPAIRERPARPASRRRAGAAGHRLGPLRAHRGPVRPHGHRVLLPLLVPRRGRGHRERPRRTAARCWSPTTPARFRPTRR